MAIKIGYLPIEKWKEFRMLRLKALFTEQVAFARSYEDELKFKPKQWKEILKSKNILFAIDNSRPVGMLSWRFDKNEKFSHVAILQGMYVEPSHRKMGIGKRLLREVIKRLSRPSSGVEKIRLGVIRPQKAAIALYKKLGFRRTGILKKEMKLRDQYHDELVMELHTKKRQ